MKASSTAKTLIISLFKDFILKSYPFGNCIKRYCQLRKCPLEIFYLEQLLLNINLSAYIQEVKKKGCSGRKTLLNGGELTNSHKNLTNISCVVSLKKEPNLQNNSNKVFTFHKSNFENLEVSVLNMFWLYSKWDSPSWGITGYHGI